jgi:hypothetical protein
VLDVIVAAIRFMPVNVPLPLTSFTACSIALRRDSHLLQKLSDLSGKVPSSIVVFFLCGLERHRPWADL